MIFFTIATETTIRSSSRNRNFKEFPTQLMPWISTWSCFFYVPLIWDVEINADRRKKMHKVRGWTYCWWLKSQTTTWDVWNPINNGKNYLPQLVVWDFSHQQYHQLDRGFFSHPAVRSIQVMSRGFTVHVQESSVVTSIPASWTRLNESAAEPCRPHEGSDVDAFAAFLWGKT